jgi:hypothetical protein
VATRAVISWIFSGNVSSLEIFLREDLRKKFPGGEDGL